MQTKHDFYALAMELRHPCIKPPKLYLNSSNGWKHIILRCSYKSDAKGGKQGNCSFLGIATLSEASKQAVVAGRACGCHIGNDKQRRNRRPWNNCLP